MIDQKVKAPCGGFRRPLLERGACGFRAAALDRVGGGGSGRAGRGTIAAVLLILSFIWPRASAEEDQGRVIYVARDLVYLDRGSLNGLAPGQVISIRRLGEEITRVEVIHTSDRRAVARPRGADVHILDGDAFQVPGLAARVEPGPEKTEQPVVAVQIPEKEWGARWRVALADAPRMLVPYREGSRGYGGFSGRVATRATVRAAPGAAWMGREEQSLFVRARARDLGFSGLDLRIRGRLGVRYDGNTDRYLLGERAIPLFREASFRYAPPDRHFVATLGRFRPIARNVGIVDGGEALWSIRGVDVGVFAGLRPSPDSLTPRSDAPAFGVGITARPVNQSTTWRLSLGAASMFYQNGASRQSVYFDNVVSVSDRMTVAESLTMDFVPGSAAWDGTSGLVVADGALFASYRTGDRSRFRVNARYNGQPLYMEVASALPPGWAEQLADQSIVRVHGGWEYGVRTGRILEPYIYFFQEIGTEYNEWVVAGGVRCHREGSGRVALDASLDYGDGTRQQARMDLGVTSRVARRIWVTTGVLDQWTFAHDSGLHTFQHLGYLRASSLMADAFQLWLQVTGAFDHDLYLQAPGGWFQGTAGLSLSW